MEGCPLGVVSFVILSQLLARPAWLTHIDVTVGSSRMWHDWAPPFPVTFLLKPSGQK